MIFFEGVNQQICTMCGEVGKPLFNVEHYCPNCEESHYLKDIVEFTWFTALDKYYKDGSWVYSGSFLVTTDLQNLKNGFNYKKWLIYQVVPYQATHKAKIMGLTASSITGIRCKSLKIVKGIT